MLLFKNISFTARAIILSTGTTVHRTLKTVSLSIDTTQTGGHCSRVMKRFISVDVYCSSNSTVLSISRVDCHSAAGAVK